MTSEEGKVTVGGREFKFVKLSIDAVMRLNKKKYESFFASLDIKKVLEDDAEYKKFGATWREFCNDAFVHDSLLWRWFGILPKQLRFDSIKLGDIPEVAQSFFFGRGGTQEPPKKPEIGSQDSSQAKQ